MFIDVYSLGKKSNKSKSKEDHNSSDNGNSSGSEDVKRQYGKNSRTDKENVSKKRCL